LFTVHILEKHENRYGYFLFIFTVLPLWNHCELPSGFEIIVKHRKTRENPSSHQHDRHVGKSAMKPIFNSGHSLAKTRIKLSGFPLHIVGVTPRGQRRSAWTVTGTSGPYEAPSSWANSYPQGSSLAIKQQPKRAAATQVNGDPEGSPLVVKRRPPGSRIRGWVAAHHKGVVARVFFSAFRVSTHQVNSGRV
jgi:hypothetical protein